MEIKALKKILGEYKKGQLSQQQVVKRLQVLPYCDMGFARLDTHRTLRFGFPEVVYAPGKTDEQVEKIILKILTSHSNFIVTRLTPERAARLMDRVEGLEYLDDARILTRKQPRGRGKKPGKNTGGYICVVCAGTADIPVAQEAAAVLEILGDSVQRLYDVGVAGLHRLLDNIDILTGASCLIVAAGMEGALPSVVGGVVARPVIAVPTSVGYGANFAGVAPLLTMLNSCSPNVVTVNIDNGFGAAFFAHLITKRAPA